MATASKRNSPKAASNRSSLGFNFATPAKFTIKDHKIDIDIIIPSQIGLHNESQLERMIEFVKSGGFFTLDVIEDFAEKNVLKNPKLIQLVKLDDGMILSHDGHHRILSVLLGGRKWLREDEYFLVERTYQMYLKPNLDRGWMTPHDPRKEIRIGDFLKFKNYVLELANNKTEAEAIEYIEKNKHEYAMPRGKIRHILNLYQNNQVTS